LHPASHFACGFNRPLARLGESGLCRYGTARTPLDSPEAAFEFWETVVATEPAFEGDKEHLVAVLLDTKLKPKGYHVVSVGSLDETVAQPRETFRAAIIAAAYGIILIHSHPSGDPSPSKSDHRMTQRMREAAEIIGIQLLDHVVVGDSEGGRQPFFSFREGGAL
jgi:DNA repair protein RadC